MINLTIFKQIGLFFGKTSATIGMWQVANKLAENDTQFSMKAVIERLEKDVKCGR